MTPPAEADNFSVPTATASSGPSPRILVAGIGNIFLGDDAFGVEVAQRLLRRAWPEHVRVRDFGIRGLDLVYALQEGWDVVMLIDAVPRGDGPPGTLYVLEPQIGTVEAGAAVLDAHAMDPFRVLMTAAAMGPLPGRIYIIGCEPQTKAADFDDGDVPLGLSAPVAAAVAGAAGMVEELVQRIGGGALPESVKTTDTNDLKEAVPCSR